MSFDTTDDAPTLRVGDNLALNFINTEHGLEELHRERLSSDQDVLEWLEAFGLVAPGAGPAPKGLLALARKLRSSARALVEAARQGEWADPEVVNQVLDSGSRSAQLSWDEAAGGFRAVKRAGRMDAPGLLAPIAEELVRLLSQADLTQVRQCEGDHCTLLFHDLTKSRRRRWCSMATCGNRMKVAAFRARQKGP
jgi:predicted RNA-binding Zn ribbon-like protein